MPISTAKTSIEIGTTATDPVGDTYVKVDGPVEIGEIGGQTERVTVNVVDSGEEEETTGVTTYPECEITFRLKPGDPGQTAVQTAFNTRDLYNFRFTLSNGDKYYQKARVLSARLATGTTEDVARWMVILSLRGAFAYEAAA